MRAALLKSPENVVVGETETPRPSTGQVLIEPIYAGICGTDISIFKGHRPVSYPFILGHEVMGRVAAPSGDARLPAGRRVIVEPNYPCGTCELCHRGRGAVCERKGSMGVNMPGCFSEYAVAPAEFVWPLPESISDEDGVTIEPLTVSLHALLQSGAREGETVAVLGCGVVGLLLIHAASAMGVNVIAHDRFPGKIEMARGLGAEIMLEAADAARIWEKEKVSVVFECAGVPATVELALQAAPRGADVVLLGLSASPAGFVPMRLVREGINVHTSMIYDHPADFARAIDLVAEGKLHPSRIVTHTFPFESIQQSLEKAAAGASGKILVRIR
ncbi:MAG TPA: alcohol dehydrogenase catalytic domain-containing protein [Acidobacteriota bacterium]|nr:alcohol dehydrogenase catalytic domain-containing protein [Acidobacteriota bacterium]